LMYPHLLYASPEHSHLQSVWQSDKLFNHSPRLGHSGHLSCHFERLLQPCKREKTHRSTFLKEIYIFPAKVSRNLYGNEHETFEGVLLTISDL
jgi:hypothetical protein